MDPLTLSTAIITIAAKCVTLTKEFSDIRSRFIFANLTIISICTESSVCSTALYTLQTCFSQHEHQEDANQRGPHHLLDQPLFLSSCDAALTGCTLILSCLDEELGSLRQAVESGSPLKWTQRARVIWKEETMQQLLQQLRGQVTALNLLLHCFQMSVYLGVDSTNFPNALTLTTKPGTLRRKLINYLCLRVAQLTISNLGCNPCEEAIQIRTYRNRFFPLLVLLNSYSTTPLLR